MEVFAKVASQGSFSAAARALGMSQSMATKHVDAIEEADAEAAADVAEPRGLLRLNAPLSFGFRQVVPALADFAALYPQLTVDLGLTDRFVDLVEEGWDLAIRLGMLRDSSLIARRL